jgi:hypothetical protein
VTNSKKGAVIEKNLLNIRNYSAGDEPQEICKMSFSATQLGSIINIQDNFRCENWSDFYK